MKHLAPLTTSRTILPLLVINLMIALVFLPAHLSDAEANRKASADSDSLVGADGDPLNRGLNLGNITPRARQDARYQRRHYGKYHSQGYQGRRVPQGYQGKRVRQGYQGRRVPQGYQFKGNPRRNLDTFHKRSSSRSTTRSFYSRQSSTKWKSSKPFAGRRTKSLWGASRDNNPNPANKRSNLFGSNRNIFGVSPKKTQKPSSSYIPFTSYGSNPYGMSNDNSQKDSSETPAWHNYSLIAPGWSGND